MNHPAPISPQGDWTQGMPAILYKQCRACAHRWYFERPMCPRCGVDAPDTQVASGRGVVHAVTTIQRAPTESLRAALPYTVALIDCEEGFRLLAHVSAGAHIGNAVVAEFRIFDGALAPFFTPSPPA